MGLDLGSGIGGSGGVVLRVPARVLRLHAGIERGQHRRLARVVFGRDRVDVGRVSVGGSCHEAIVEAGRQLAPAGKVSCGRAVIGQLVVARVGHCDRRRPAKVGRRHGVEPRLGLGMGLALGLALADADAGAAAAGNKVVGSAQISRLRVVAVAGLERARRRRRFSGCSVA
ncbi:hypothetical protein TgHK011_003627 [Trichoderma gracile]|nr:hypothetical protein TgHK011_003627 [Trichoderma gracile]